MGSRYRPHTTHLSAPRCRRQHEFLPQLCWYDCWGTWCRIAWQGRLLIRRIHQGSYHEVETAQQILLHAPSLKSSDRLRGWDVASCPCLLLAAATAARTDQAHQRTCMCSAMLCAYGMSTPAYLASPNSGLLPSGMLPAPDQDQCVCCPGYRTAEVMFANY